MILTQSDRDRLVAMLTAYGAPQSLGSARTALMRAVDAADIVDVGTVPDSVVTMNSVVNVIDIETGAIASYTLVFPRDANADRGKVSVLAPLGTALLGRLEGEIIEFDVSAGTKQLFIQKVTFQPESRVRHDTIRPSPL